MSVRSRPMDPYSYEVWAWDQVSRLRQSLTPTEALVLIALARHGNEDGIASPSARRLAQDWLGRDEAVVRRALPRLVALGLIAPVEAPGRKVKVWKLRAVDAEEPSASGISAANPLDADGGSASGARMRTRCGQDADGSSAEVEVEGKEGVNADAPEAYAGGEDHPPPEALLLADAALAACNEHQLPVNARMHRREVAALIAGTDEFLAGLVFGQDLRAVVADCAPKVDRWTGLLRSKRAVGNTCAAASKLARKRNSTAGSRDNGAPDAALTDKQRAAFTRAYGIELPSGATNADAEAALEGAGPS